MAKLYGTIYKPLIANVRPNRDRQGQVVAFIENQLCFFDRSSVIPEPGERVEVMIVHPVYGLYPEGHPSAGIANPNSLVALRVRVIDPLLHMLVAIDVFEYSRTTHRVSARGRETDGTRVLTSSEVYPPKQLNESKEKWADRSQGSMWVTPGSTGIIVGPGVQNHLSIPTNVWVERSKVEKTKGCGVRICGLSRMEDGQWYHLTTPAKKQQKKETKAQNTPPSVGSFGYILSAEINKSI